MRWCLTACHDLNAPAVFRYTACAAPERHLLAAEALARNRAFETGWMPERSGRSDYVYGGPEDPNGLGALVYPTADLPVVGEGLLPPHRVTKLSPPPLQRVERNLALLF